MYFFKTSSARIVYIYYIRPENIARGIEWKRRDEEKKPLEFFGKNHEKV